MISYNKDEIKNNLTLDNIYELLHLWGGNPEFTNFGILSETICHNPPYKSQRPACFFRVVLEHSRIVLQIHLPRSENESCSALPAEPVCQ